ncbi:Hypothetical protein NCS54_01169000 [Fusarium falciforme]|uniref:Hypothetical protein n=1 Tax=Fusarium falciforme TaxID=195108 RepID=UPI002300DD1F|nr:Hypothetical protein NCS54_01169000 [Fusarium falciforme]WAO94122.1 Hypothetical protein NCS54_01169000 [Fusarium falciforme]
MAATFPHNETKDFNAPILYGDGEIEDARLLTPCSPDTPIVELRRRYWHGGIIWVKGLLDPDLVNDFRAAYLSMTNVGTEILKIGTDPRDGIFNPDTDWREFTLPGALRIAAGLPDTGPFVENAIRSHHWSPYQEFKDAVGRRIEPFIGNIFLRAGPPTSVTAWVPIGDVEVEGGGLIYLDRAHDIGVKYEDDFSKMNASLSDEERMSAFNKTMEKGG